MKKGKHVLGISDYRNTQVSSNKWLKVQKCQEIRGEKKSTKVSSIQWLKKYN